jgi:hypothetical protein
MARNHDLNEAIPTFERDGGSHENVGLSNWSALTQPGAIRSGWEALVIVLVAVAVVGGIQLWLELSNTQSYIFPKPTEIGSALWNNFDLFRPHLFSTL